MRFVYFESLATDGTLEPHLISSDEIDVVRPLSSRELRFAQQLQDGYFGERPFNQQSRYEKMRWESDTQCGRDFRIAQSGGYDVTHGSAKSVLRLKSGYRHFLPESVGDLAVSLNELQILNGEPQTSANEKSVVLGRPRLPKTTLLLEHKRLT